MYRVIIADDEPIMRKALNTLINWSDLGCEVIYTASNGQEVIDNLSNTMPDILVTDIKMPMIDGIALTKYISDNKLPIQVIILTAYADFSYAQAALKYQVVDYVVKIGAFEGIVEAIEKAKLNLVSERQTNSGDGGSATIENFLKSIFDGSLYDREEIRIKGEAQGISLDKFLVLLFHFNLEEGISYERRVKIYDSLLNFFGMVFRDQVFQGVFVKRDMLALVLNQVEEDYQEEIQDKCMQVIDMMDNFMKLTVYIAISAINSSIIQLKDGYEQAKTALDRCFLDESSKINYYKKNSRETVVHLAEVEQEIEHLCFLISQGRTEEGMAQFQKLLALQKKHRYHGNIIKNTGILVRSRCRKMLAEYDKDLYDITVFQHSISNQINSCLHVDEYSRIMDEIIGKTSNCIQMHTNRKHSLIIDCEQFIEKHYRESISVTDIAEYIGVSASYLSRIFKEATGNTIIYTLNQKKVDKAKEYLLDTDMKIYEIADALGFENFTYFSHFFKKHTGISPKDYKG